MMRNLSGICSELTRIAHAINGVSDDMQAFNAPSECGEYVYKQLRREALTTITRAGWYPSVLREVIKRRTSPKTLSNMRISFLIPDQDGCADLY